MGGYPLLFETIKIEAGQPFHMEYHNRRCNNTRKELFGTKVSLDIREHLAPPAVGLFRCRVLYDREIQNIEYIPYQPKNIQKIALVEHSVEYSYKYADRSEFDQILKSMPECDDALILKGGLLTDTTIANIAFLEKNQWITPKSALLEGTTRQRLIDKGFLMPKNIFREEIDRFDGFALMNAMIGFKIIKPIWVNKFYQK